MKNYAVIYWSGTGNTEIMAKSVFKGIKELNSEVEIYNVSEITVEDAKKFSHIAFGCPSMGAEVLEETEFDPFFTKLEGSLSGIKVALFGSYGWGDGEWMRDWETRTENAGAQLFEEGLILGDKPTSEGEDECYQFGKKFAAF